METSQLDPAGCRRKYHGQERRRLTYSNRPSADRYGGRLAITGKAQSGGVTSLRAVVKQDRTEDLIAASLAGRDDSAGRKEVTAEEVVQVWRDVREPMISADVRHDCCEAALLLYEHCFDNVMRCDMARKAFLAGLLMLAAASVAVARTNNDVTTTYFSDPAKTKWVGETELTCGGGIIRFGHTSAFFTRSSDSCSQTRMNSVTFKRLSGTPADKAAACHFRCGVKFGHPQLCTPDACPGTEALKECNAGCDELEQSNR